MIQTFFIPGPLPGLNELIDAAQSRARTWGRSRRQWNGYANLKKQQGETAYWQLLKQHMQPMRRVRLTFVWQERNRFRDPDNIAAGGRKIILDAMVKAKILNDDGWRQIDGWSDHWVVVNDSPGVTVRMDDMEPIEVHDKGDAHNVYRKDAARPHHDEACENPAH